MKKMETVPAYDAMAGRPGNRLLLLCDHADNYLPPEYGTLGLRPEDLERHIAYDLGARPLTSGVAKRLGAAALFTRHSRLLIDPNRGTDDPTLIMRLSDGAIVPGNAAVDAEERRRRIERYHGPYHSAINAELERLLAGGLQPLIVSIHSFTPYWRGTYRPWHIGILWDRDERVAEPMIAALRSEKGLEVGDNEPYSGALEGDTLSQHGTDRGIEHVLVEIRQDLITSKSGVDEWAERLARVVQPFM